MNNKYSSPKTPGASASFSLEDAQSLIDQLQVFSMRLDSRTMAIMDVIGTTRTQRQLLHSFTAQHMDALLGALTEADPQWGARLHAIYQYQLALERDVAGPN